MRAVVVALISLMGCGFEITGGLLPTGVDGAAGDGSGDGPSDAMIDAPVVLGAWGTPTLVPLIGGGGGDDDPSLTADRLELYFNRAGDIYVARRSAVTDAWMQPARVTELSSASGETTPEVTSDGLTIFFASSRAGGPGSEDVWMSTRASRSAPWGTPTVVPVVSSPQGDSAPAVTDDLLAMVITSARTGTMFNDVFTSTRATATAAWSTPVALSTINTPGNDYSPILTQDKLTVYLDANPVGGTSDLYTAVRGSTAAEFSAPTVITELSTSANDSDPWVSADGRHIYFVSDRAGGFSMYEAAR